MQIPKLGQILPGGAQKRQEYISRAIDKNFDDVITYFNNPKQRQAAINRIKEKAGADFDANHTLKGVGKKAADAVVKFAKTPQGKIAAAAVALLAVIGVGAKVASNKAKAKEAGEQEQATQGLYLAA